MYRCNYYCTEQNRLSSKKYIKSHIPLLVPFATANSSIPFGEKDRQISLIVYTKRSTQIVLSRTNLQCDGPHGDERQIWWTSCWGLRPHCLHSDGRAVQTSPPHSPAAQTGWGWNTAAGQLFKHFKPIPSSLKPKQHGTVIFLKQLIKLKILKTT